MPSYRGKLIGRLAILKLEPSRRNFGEFKMTLKLTAAIYGRKTSAKCRSYPIGRETTIQSG